MDPHTIFTINLRKAEIMFCRFETLLEPALRTWGHGALSTTGQLGGPSGGEGQRGAKAKQHQRKSLKLSSTPS